MIKPPKSHSIIIFHRECRLVYCGELHTILQEVFEHSNKALKVNVEVVVHLKGKEVFVLVRAHWLKNTLVVQLDIGIGC